MVRRYNYCEGDEDMCEDIHGAYVSYHDYADLESENARLREALRECVAVMTSPEISGVGSRYVAVVRKAREVLGDD